MWPFSKKNAHADAAPKARKAPVQVASELQLVPHGVQVAGAWAWRLVALAAAAAVVVFLIKELSIIVIPLLVAALLTALLSPLVSLLVRFRWPRPLAVATALIGFIAVVTALIWLSVTQIRDGYPDLQQRALTSWEGFKTLLLESPLHVTEDDINRYTTEVIGAVQADIRDVLSGALSVGTSLGQVAAGAILALFATLFLLLDGRRIWLWIVGLFPKGARGPLDGSTRAGWMTLENFVRVQVAVAAIDAIGIGIGAFFLGMPLVIPVAILVFLGSFIPFVGAIATGALAVAIALVALGPVQALIMLGVVLLVQQIESNVLQPLIMGTAVRVHPLAVVIAVAGGSIIAGIPGALFAVPIVAFLNVVVKSMAQGTWRAPESAAEGGPRQPRKKRGESEPSDDDAALAAAKPAAGGAS